MVIAAEALNGLLRTLEQLVPNEADATLQARLSLSALRLAPSGVGGFVGLSHEPQGEIHAQRVQASVRIAVRAADADGLGAAVDRVSQALLGADRADLRGRGILRLGLEQLGDLSLVSAGDDQQVAQRELQFSLLYEYLQPPPPAGEGVIEQVPLDLELGGGRTPRLLLATDFGAEALSWFDIFDDAAATTAGPSQWAVNPTERRIEQRSGIRSGSTAPNANKPGSYLVLRRAALQDGVIHAEMSADNDRGLGLIFRWQDVDNFGFFVMNTRDSFRLLGKKSNAQFALLERSAVDTSAGFPVGALNDVKLVAKGASLRVWLNGDLILNGEDNSLVRAGRIGFVCQGNNQANFLNLRLFTL
jgi:hypothetical protein